MLKFKPFSVPALQAVLPYIRKNPSLCSDLSAGYLFMWQEGTDVQFCVWNDTFTVRQNIGEQPAFSFPMGADPDGMIDRLLAYVEEAHLPLRFFAVDDQLLERIRGDARLQPAMWAFERRWSDYIYDFGEAMSFRGKKFNGQRNHINKFKRLYGEPELRFLSPADRPLVEALLAEYETAHAGGGALERLELRQSAKLFDLCGDLGLCAAGLFAAGELAAFSIGEVVGDCLLIHVEKALTRFEGVYPAAYSGFVRLMAERLGRPLRYVNREDDSGDPGLRISKLQYHPVRMADKHLVHVRTPALRAEPAVCLPCRGVVLTELRPGDRAAYLRLNTDVENNRFWGYDYREDLRITGPVDEDTFYESVQYDMRAGDSVNLAVRLTEDGEMIGEAILWNFSADGAGELGCRILREYQGKGYGTAAFGAAADYGRRRLGLRLFARCFRGNAASRRMITANGFLPQREDETFFWFEDMPCWNCSILPSV